MVFNIKSWLWVFLIFSTIVISAKIFNVGYPFLGLLLFFTIISAVIFKLFSYIGNK